MSQAIARPKPPAAATPSTGGRALSSGSWRAGTRGSAWKRARRGRPRSAGSSAAGSRGRPPRRRRGCTQGRRRCRGDAVHARSIYAKRTAVSQRQLRRAGLLGVARGLDVERVEHAGDRSAKPTASAVRSTRMWLIEASDPRLGSSLRLDQPACESRCWRTTWPRRSRRAGADDRRVAPLQVRAQQQLSLSRGVGPHADQRLALVGDHRRVDAEQLRTPRAPPFTGHRGLVESSTPGAALVRHLVQRGGQPAAGRVAG